MIDQFGRSIDYLRLSVTERCTLRCTYCRVEEGICPKAAELSADEYARIGKACARLGIHKVRITGGEPLLRKDILEIIQKLSAIDAITEITMTTNAQQLAGRANALKEAGLKRLNISLDTLDAAKYHEMTGGELSTVLSAIDEAIEAQLLPLKINTVIVKGKNDDEVDDLMALAKERPIEVRFIELMPIGALGQNDAMRVNNDVLIAARPFLQPLPPCYPGQPARDYAVDGYMGRVGFISPLSHKFCASCNRIRVMSDGKIRPCLGSNMEIETKEALASKDDEVLLETIRNAIYHKPDGHHFNTGFISEKNMSRIGG
ncbi:MAG TPA: GTP 3',8-cyclase MoaA [Anaerolineaceae bacterium]|nr:GTP 3',8-cyclase MoaA [Anaerolineaceae bacterium]